MRALPGAVHSWRMSEASSVASRPMPGKMVVSAATNRTEASSWPRSRIPSCNESAPGSDRLDRGHLHSPAGRMIDQHRDYFAMSFSSFSARTLTLL